MNPSRCPMPGKLALPFTRRPSTRQSTSVYPCICSFPVDLAISAHAPASCLRNVTDSGSVMVAQVLVWDYG